MEEDDGLVGECAVAGVEVGDCVCDEGCEGGGGGVGGGEGDLDENDLGGVC